MASTVIPKARARAATPAAGMTDSDQPEHLAADIVTHEVFTREARVRAGAVRSHSPMRLETASIRPSVCSATDRALPPAWFTTATPAFVHAATSTVS